MSWGNPNNTNERLLRALAMPLTLPYQFALGLHQLAYKKHWLPTGKLSQPVISVGNITVGGTGKTPIIIDLASKLLANNIKVGILSRGYKRLTNSQCTVVSDGNGNFAPVNQSGDEALLIAKILPKAIVIVDPNRFSAGQLAIAQYGCQILLLDDAFQHWRLQRDVDVVLLNYFDELKHDALLPAGRMREPLSALKRATQIVITKVPANHDQKRLQRLQELARRYSPQAKISTCTFKANSIYQLISGQWATTSISKLEGLPVVAFCGIASPENFFSQVKDLGANLLDQISFPDHHHYSQNDLLGLKAKLKESGASYLITTRKDLVKLDSSPVAPHLLSVNLETVWLDQSPDLTSLLNIPYAHPTK